MIKYMIRHPNNCPLFIAFNTRRSFGLQTCNHHKGPSMAPKKIYLSYDQDYVFRSEDNRYLLGSRYYIDFENEILNPNTFVFEGYLKSNNHFIST